MLVARGRKPRRITKVLVFAVSLLAVASIGEIAPAATPTHCGNPLALVQGGIPGTVKTSDCTFAYTGGRVLIYASGLGGGRMATSQLGIARFRVDVLRGLTKLAECSTLPGTFISVLGCAQVFKPNAPVGTKLRCRSYLYTDFNPGVQAYSWRCASLPA